MSLSNRQLAGTTVVRVIEALSSEQPSVRAWRRPAAVLESATGATPARILRDRRERLIAHLRGNPEYPASELIYCIGLKSDFDEMATELLVRSVRLLHFNATAIDLDDLARPDFAPPLGRGVSTVFLISVDSVVIERTGQAAADTIRLEFPGAQLVTVFNPLFFPEMRGELPSIEGPVIEAKSFDEAIHVLDRPVVSDNTERTQRTQVG